MQHPMIMIIIMRRMINEAKQFNYDCITHFDNEQCPYLERPYDDLDTVRHQFTRGAL